MDDLRKSYTELRTEYKKTLDHALREPEPEIRKELVLKLIDLNTRMSEVVSNMMKTVAQAEPRVNLDELNTHLSDELVRIQREARDLHVSHDEREVIRRLTPPPSQQVNTPLYLYLGAILVGLFLVILGVLNASFVTPAMPPIATPQLGLTGSIEG